MSQTEGRHPAPAGQAVHHGSPAPLFARRRSLRPGDPRHCVLAGRRGRSHLFQGGGDALLDYLVGAVQGMHTAHRISNILIDFDGADRARCRILRLGLSQRAGRRRPRRCRVRRSISRSVRTAQRANGASRERRVIMDYFQRQPASSDLGVFGSLEITGGTQSGRPALRLVPPVMTLKLVWEPIRIGGLEIPNRIARAANTTTISPAGIDEQFIAYHRARARGGVGLSILEAAGVHPTSVLSYRDRGVHVPWLRAAHAGGAPLRHEGLPAALARRTPHARAGGPPAVGAGRRAEPVQRPGRRPDGNRGDRRGCRVVCQRCEDVSRRRARRSGRSTQDTAISFSSSCRRSPTRATTDTAGRCRIACASRWRCSARSGAPSVADFPVGARLSTSTAPGNISAAELGAARADVAGRGPHLLPRCLARRLLPDGPHDRHDGRGRRLRARAECAAPRLGVGSSHGHRTVPDAGGGRRGAAGRRCRASCRWSARRSPIRISSARPAKDAPIRSGPASRATRDASEACCRSGAWDAW